MAVPYGGAGHAVRTGFVDTVLTRSYGCHSTSLIHPSALNAIGASRRFANTSDTMHRDRLTVRTNGIPHAFKVAVRLGQVIWRVNW